jgi:4,5-dihydroxyphthalate decarboxylase
MSTGTKITLACRNYDGTNAILCGRIRLPGLDLDVRETDDVGAMFSGMFKGEFDVSEMSLGELVYYTSRDKVDFIGIPIFPSRVFRHGFIFCRTAAGVRRPQELDGKRIGFVRWIQTAAIWMRGILTEEYGLSPDRTGWYVASMHHWDDADPNTVVNPRDGSTICRINTAGKNESERVCSALSVGEIDAVGVTDSQRSVLLYNKAVRPLFENDAEVEAEYFRRTKILPIMHVLAVRKESLNRDPELPHKLFELFAAAKKWARQWKRTTPSLVLAWTEKHLDEESGIFNGDPWAYGLKENRHVIDKFLAYCYAQGVSGRKISAEELFVPSTWGLTE